MLLSVSFLSTLLTERLNRFFLFHWGNIPSRGKHTQPASFWAWPQRRWLITSSMHLWIPLKGIEKDMVKLKGIRNQERAVWIPLAKRRVYTKKEWVQERVRDLPDCCREWDRKETKHIKGQRKTSQFLNLFDQMWSGGSRKKVILVEVNKSRNVTTVTGWKCTRSRNLGGILKTNWATNASLQAIHTKKHLTPVSNMRGLQFSSCEFTQFTLHKPSRLHHTYSPVSPAANKELTLPQMIQIIYFALCYTWWIVLWRKIYDYDVFNVQGLAINVWWLSLGLAEYCHTWQGLGYMGSHLTSKRMWNTGMFGHCPQKCLQKYSRKWGLGSKKDT